MSMNMYVFCDSCHQEFKTTLEKGSSFEDLPQTCMSCLSEEISEEIREDEIRKKFHLATQNDHWHWKEDALSFDPLFMEEDDIGSFPLLASENPITKLPSSKDEFDSLPEALVIRVNALIAALNSNN